MQVACALGPLFHPIQHLHGVQAHGRRDEVLGWLDWFCDDAASGDVVGRTGNQQLVRSSDCHFGGKLTRAPGPLDLLRRRGGRNQQTN